MVTLPREEAELIEYHLARLGRFRTRNQTKNDYYEAKQRVKGLGRNLPPQLRSVETAVGWPGTVVDVLEERLDFLGWSDTTGDDPHNLRKVYVDNDLDVESSAGHHDGLITGSGFVIVGAGDAGESPVLITVESPDRVTGEWDRRLRRLSSALAVDKEADGQVQEVTLFLANSNVSAVRRSGLWVELSRDAHALGRCQVVQLPNKPRGSRKHGRSEITPALRAYTDEAVRTLLGMDVHREFYQAPQRYILNAQESWFEDSDGNAKSGWDTVQGRVLAVPANDDADPGAPEVKVGQFDPAPPTPYLDIVRGLAELVSAEGGLPLSYFGITTANPPSADAIRALEARLIKKAERRQATFGRGWREVAALALLIRDGVLPENFDTVAAKWRDAATPTRSAAADEVVKYVGAGIFPATSTVAYDRMGLSPSEQRTLKSEKLREDAKVKIAGLALAANAARQATPSTAPAEAPANGG